MGFKSAQKGSRDELLFEPANDVEVAKTKPWKSVSTLVAAASWTTLPAAEFMKGSDYMKEYIESVLILTLIYSLTPTETGFVLNGNSFIGARTTYSEAFKRFYSNPILRPVIALNQSLGRAKKSNFRKSTNELVNTYAKAIKLGRELYIEQTMLLKNKMAPYYRFYLEKIGANELGDFCYKELEAAERWFISKSTVGAVLPLGRWFYLPPLSDFGDTRS